MGELVIARLPVVLDVGSSTADVDPAVDQAADLIDHAVKDRLSGSHGRVSH
jgi:hypothetical protein